MIDNWATSPDLAASKIDTKGGRYIPTMLVKCIRSPPPLVLRPQVRWDPEDPSDQLGQLVCLDQEVVPDKTVRMVTPDTLE